MDRVSALEKALEKSPYFEYLCRSVSSIGFAFNDGVEVVKVAGKPNAETDDLINALGLTGSNIGIIDITTLNSTQDATVDLWVEIDEKELIQLAEKGIPLSRLRIFTDSGEVENYPVIENIMQRIFTSSITEGFPPSDRIELIYSTIFKFKEPRLYWRSENNDLFVLKFEEGYDGLDVFVTSGFTNSARPQSQIEFEEGAPSGFGYELMVMTQSGEDILAREFVDWVKYIEESGRHIYPGQYLMNSQEKIPGTQLSGFIVVPPIDFPEKFPVEKGWGMFNLLIGVTKEELALAIKEDDVYIVADHLFEAGYINYSPIERSPVI